MPRATLKANLQLHSDHPAVEHLQLACQNWLELRRNPVLEDLTSAGWASLNQGLFHVRRAWAILEGSSSFISDEELGDTPPEDPPEHPGGQHHGQDHSTRSETLGEIRLDC